MYHRAMTALKWITAALVAMLAVPAHGARRRAFDAGRVRRGQFPRRPMTAP